MKAFPEIGGGLGVRIDKESFGVGAAEILQRILEGKVMSEAKVKGRSAGAHMESSRPVGWDRVWVGTRGATSMADKSNQT